MGQTGSNNNSNYNYIGSGTPDYYGNFSTKLKKGAESVYGWTDSIEAGLLGAGAMMPWLEPLLLPFQVLAGGISAGAHIAEGLMEVTDGIVGSMDMKNDINGTLERDYYPERYASSKNRNTIEKAPPPNQPGKVNFNNNTFGDQLSEKSTSSTDRYGNVVSSVNSAFSQYKGLTTI